MIQDIYTTVQTVDEEAAAIMQAEEKRQKNGMELIASENYQSPAVLAAQSSLLANKYSEGYPGKRYYGGQENTDRIESLAIHRAKKLFGADHANVQALSGAAANVCAYAAMMEPEDTILGMKLSHGGHLTHGSPVTFLSKVFQFERYGLTHDGRIDYEQVRSLAHQHKPKVILAGFSAYPRELDYAIFAEIAQEVGAYAYADVSHIGGLIAGKALANPLDYGFHAMMTTTHKSMRGPRGALLLTKGNVGNPLKKPEPIKENLPTIMDRSVFPGVQGGPHMHTVAAIAVALHEASQPSYQSYAQQILANAQIMAERFLYHGYDLVTGGTDNHMVVVDFSQSDMPDGKKAESVLDKIGISTSKSSVPDDSNPPFRPSGLRVGIQAMTTRGVEEEDTKQIVDFIHDAFVHRDDAAYLEGLQKDVASFCQKFPLP